MLKSIKTAFVELHLNVVLQSHLNVVLQFLNVELHLKISLKIEFKTF